MQLHEVDEIKELFIVDEVNQALQHGWRIVAVVAAEYGDDDTAVVPCYVMGRKDLTKPQKPVAPTRTVGVGSSPRRLSR